MDADNDSDEDYMEPENKLNSDANTTGDPLSTVLNSDLGMGEQMQLLCCSELCLGKINNSFMQSCFFFY